MTLNDAAPDDEGRNRSARRVAVVGGGITGLAAAQRLIALDDRIEVTLFEADDRTGGMIRTESCGDFLVEHGPDSFITNKPGGIQFCEDIGFADQLIPTDETHRRSLVVRNGRPLPVPDGFMLMAPAKPMAILTTSILSVSGKLRLLREAFVARRTTAEDESLASFVRRRFGTETLDRLVQPLVGGIYTADPEKLSLMATLPRFLHMEQSHGSVIRATLAEQRAKKSTAKASSGSGARYGLFTTPKAGLSSLITAAEQHLARSGRVQLRTSTPVRTVSTTRQPGSDCWRVNSVSGEDSAFDSVIMTLPAFRTADVLFDEPFWPLAEKLRQIEYASSAVVVTGHRLSDFNHPLDAFGLVIPRVENRNVLAVSFASRKFPCRAPENHILLRTFVGGAMQPELLQQDDASLSSMVHDELSQLLGMQSPPIFSSVSRYENAMPQYHVGHLDIVAQIDDFAAEHDGLYLAGNAYKGVGIPDSITSGRTAAESCVARFNGTCH